MHSAMTPRKPAIAVLAGIIVAMLLSVAASGEVANHPVTIQLWGLPEMDLFEGYAAVLKEYEAKHPEIRIERGTPGGQVGLDPQKLMTAFVSGKPPDIVWMDRFELAGWAARGVFRPLDDLFDRDGIDRKDFYPACLDECIYEGKTYGLPWNTDSRALWVNMAILKRFGYDAPPADWDELAAMAGKMTTRTDLGNISTIGFAPLFGNSWLYIFGWLNGGEFTSPDGRRITLTDPRIVEALEWMAAVYRSIGGAKQANEFNTSAQLEGAAEPFISGKIAMRIDGNWALDYVAKYAPNMDFKVVLPPAPKGKKPISWSGGFCWSIPKGAAHTEQAWQLAKFLSSEECWVRAGELQAIANQRRAKAQNLEGGYFIPQLSCSRKINDALIQRFAPQLPAHIREGFMTHVAALDVCRFRPVLPVGKLLWDEHVRATFDVLLADAKPIDALSAAERRVQVELDKYFAPPTAPVYPIGTVFTWLFGVVLIAGLAIWAAAAARWHWTPRAIIEARTGVLFAMPWLLGFLLLLVGPMLASLLMSFSEYNVVSPARWVGLQNFRTMFGSMRTAEGQTVHLDPQFWKALWNTVFVTAIGVPLGIVASLALALLLNKEVRGIRIYRTLFYLPVVVPLAATAILWMWLLNNETGLTGVTLVPLMRHLGLEPISFFSDPHWAGMGIVLMVTWGAGGGMIIWLAGLKNIPTTYYEAAAIDGAGSFQQFVRITLPLLSPYFFFNLIMGIIGWLQIFTQAYVLIVPPEYGPGDSLFFYVLYLFVQGFQYFKMGYACAMAWVLFVIVAVLTLIQFKLAPKWVHYDI
jgi:ABC-type sugar transport system permease subunit/ABC-type glycerol-3-phosphate transport system substrate-binding protein